MMRPAEVADALREARQTVVLTGAGISTSAGIPDFRGPRGIYVTRAYAEDIFDIETFVADPRGFYAFARDFLRLQSGLTPSPTHRLLARLEERGLVTAVITQNIDGLHQRAGSRRVLEVHGGFDTTTCLRCHERRPTAAYAPAVTAGAIPRCPGCGGLVKPDIVFFGEAVQQMEEAAALVRESGLVLVIGSSLTVYPAAGLPSLASGPVIVVTRGPVSLPPGARRVDAEIDPFFGSVAQALGLHEEAR